MLMIIISCNNISIVSSLSSRAAQENGHLPGAIVVFRDGVGDGHLKYVAAHEVAQFENAFKNFSGDYRPRFAFVVVQKRINTRIFARQVRACGRANNMYMYINLSQISP